MKPCPRWTRWLFGSLSLIWSYPTGGGNSSPAVHDGTVFVGGAGFYSYLYALDAASGSLRWKYLPYYRGAVGSPAVSQGRVFLNTYVPEEGDSYAIDEKTGNLDWTLDVYFCPCFTVRAISATVEEPLIYYGIVRGNLYSLGPGLVVLETANGEAIDAGWDTDKNVYSTPAVVNGVAYFGADDQSVNAVYGSTRLWVYKTGDSVESSPAMVHGVVFVGSKDKNVYALKADSGALLWKYTTAGFVQSSPAVANDVVYVGAYAYLYALDARSGSLLWKYPTNGFVQSSPAVANGVVYFGSDDGNLYALNAKTGALLWKYNFGTSVQSSPAVVNAMVYLSTGKNFYAFGLPGSAKGVSAQPPDPSTLVPDLQLKPAQESRGSWSNE